MQERIEESPRPADAARWAVPLLVAAALALIAGLLLTSGAARTWLEVVTLGVVEGVTEFLPISSTGHLLLTSDLLGFEHSIGGTFEIFIQLGAVFAVVLYYLRDLLAQARAVRTSREVQRFWLAIVVAFIPAAAIGLLTRDWIKTVLFDSPTTIAWSLIVGGVVMIVVERFLRPRERAPLERITLRQALVVGLMQTLALVPGVSRSGSAMVGGLVAGLDRKSATSFSFYLAIPTLGLATIVDLLGSLDALAPGDLGRLLVGAVVAFVVAWFSIDWLLRYVAGHSFVAFGVYRIVAGALILALVAVGIMG